MSSKPSDLRRSSVPITSGARPLKVVIAGGFASGKTTMVDAISEIAPLTTEAPMTTNSIGVDDAGDVRTKTTTTVAMDFGRLTLSESTILYVFGTPGQDRFWYMWDELAKGAVGAVVLVDTRRLNQCFAALDYFEKRRMPYVVAINRFDGVQVHSNDEVREALSLAADIPVVTVDARDQGSAKMVLVELVRHAITRKTASVGAR